MNMTNANSSSSSLSSSAVITRAEQLLEQHRESSLTNRRLMEAALAQSVRDLLTLVGQWEPIESAPKDGQFLVTDGQRQMVASGLIVRLWRQSTPTPVHLGGQHWTHWQPLPDPPSADPRGGTRPQQARKEDA